MNSKSAEKFLLVRVNGEKYAFKLETVDDVVCQFEFTDVPNGPSYLLGLINVRGKIINVMDLACRLGKEKIKIQENKSAIIITLIEDVAIGVLVEEVIQVKAFSTDVIHEFDFKTKKATDFVTGVIKSQDENTLVLDVRKTVNLNHILSLKEKASA